MKRNRPSNQAFSIRRLLVAFALCGGAVVFAMLGLAATPSSKMMPSTADSAPSENDSGQFSANAVASQSGVSTFLASVTCTSASDCWAVGYYHYPNRLIPRTLIEHWDGTAWTVASSPNVNGDYNQLTGVTCTSASDCWAVGYYRSCGIYQSLTSTGTEPHGQSSRHRILTTQNFPLGVTCTSAADCWAVSSPNLYIGTEPHGLRKLVRRGSLWSTCISIRLLGCRRPTLLGRNRMDRRKFARRGPCLWSDLHFCI
jgi:hypothetical protein